MDNAAIMPGLMLSEFVIRFEHDWRATALGERKSRRNSDDPPAHHHGAISRQYHFRLVPDGSGTKGLFSSLRCGDGKRAQKTVAGRMFDAGRVPHIRLSSRIMSVRSRRLPQPDLPRSAAFRIKLVKVLLVFERVHRGDEPLIRVREELILRDQPLKWFFDELFTGAHIIEYVAPEHKEPVIDSEVGISHRFDFADGAICKA